MTQKTTRYVDIHCHIIPCVDDGPSHISKSLTILENATKSGFTDLILTPHFIQDSPYSFSRTTNLKILDILKQQVKLHNLPLNLHLGNEAYLSSSLPDYLEQGLISPLADSHYLLVELPLTTEDQTASNIFFRLQTLGYTPIIAHPERYLYFQQNPQKILPYLEQGCLLQGDYQSLFGKYGHHAKKTLTRLLKANKIHFLASDTHKPTDNYNLKKAINKVTRLSSNKTANLLFSDNPSKILSNQPF